MINELKVEYEKSNSVSSSITLAFIKTNIQDKLRLNSKDTKNLYKDEVINIIENNFKEEDDIIKSLLCKNTNKN